MEEIYSIVKHIEAIETGDFAMRIITRVAVFIALISWAGNSNADSRVSQRERIATDLQTILARLLNPSTPDGDQPDEYPAPELEVVEHEIHCSIPQCREFEYRLKFSGSPDEFLLGRLLRDSKYSIETEVGFDKASLELKWVKSTELLLVRWHTLYQGRIGAAVHSLLLLRRVDSTWEPLVFDNACSPTAGPRHNPGTGNCTFEFMLQEESKSLYLIESARDWSRSATYCDRWISIWPCSLDAPLQFQPGVLVFVPGEGTSQGDTLQITENVRIKDRGNGQAIEEENWLTGDFPGKSSEHDGVQWAVVAAPIHAYTPDSTIYFHMVETAELPMRSTANPPLVIRP